MLSVVSLPAVGTISVESVLLVGMGEDIVESVVLTAVGMTAVLVVLVAAAEGAQAASATMQIAITRLKIFFRYISFLQLYTVPHACLPCVM